MLFGELILVARIAYMPRFGEGDHRHNRPATDALDAPVDNILGDVWAEIWSRLFVAVIAEDAVPPDDQHLAHRLFCERVKGQIGQGCIGEEILGAPPAEGITLWAYVLPVAGFVGGGGIAALVLRRIVRRGKDSALSGDADGGDSSNAPAPFSDASDASGDDLARLVDAEIALRR